MNGTQTISSQTRGATTSLPRRSAGSTPIAVPCTCTNDHDAHQREQTLTRLEAHRATR